MSIWRMNDWPVRRFLSVALTFPLVMLCLSLVEISGYHVPVITPALGFICVLFLPGVTFLRILRLHQLGSARTILYSTGLSIIFLMVLGLLMNFLYPVLGIARPLDKLPVVLTVFPSLILISVIAGFRDRIYSVPVKTEWLSLFSPISLFLVLLPILAVLGAQLVNTYQNNLVLMVLMVLLAVIPLMAILIKCLPEKFYPVAVVSVALSLLLHRALISGYLWGADIIREFACWRTVALNGVWSSNSPNLIPAYNTSLAVTVLPQVLAGTMHIDGLWVFKAVWPVLLALVPLAMYEVIKRQFSSSTALLAVFLVMSLYVFYTTFLGTGKQLIATVFLILWMLVMVDREIRPGVQTFLLGIFGAGVIVAHYSTAFLLVIMVVMSTLMLRALRRKSGVFNYGMLAVMVLFTVGWYWINASGAVFKQFLGMGSTAVSTEIGAGVTGVSEIGAGVTGVSEYAGESHRLITQGGVNLPDSLRYLYLLTQFFIVAGAAVGFARWLFRQDTKLSDEYIMFSMLFTGLLGLELLLPRFSLVISLDRVYLVCLLALAPFSITGLNLLGSFITKIITSKWWQQGWQRVKSAFSLPEFSDDNPVTQKAFALFLLVFLLANTGLIYELAGQPLATSIALSAGKTDFPVFNDGEFAAARWLMSNNATAKGIYYDTTTQQLFAYMDASGDMTGVTPGQILYRPQSDTNSIVTDVPPNSYVYFRSFNIDTGKLALGWPAYQTMDVIYYDVNSLGSFSQVLADSDVVYVNGRSQVLYTLTAYQAGKEDASQ